MKMSFFNSLQQYVSTGVANLTLNSKRFSLSRDNSPSGNYSDISPSEHVGAGSGRSASAGNAISAGGSNSTSYGFPKVVPTPGTTSPFPRARRKTIECPPGPPSLGIPTTPRRVGSFRHQRPARAPLMFCRRRQSWPEFDQQATSGVQETDGSFFESFTALTWKQENRRLLIHQDIEMRTEEPPTPPSRTSADTKISTRDLEHLYVEVLYTIKNKVGVSTGQYAHYQEELYQYAQEAFGIPPQRHRKLLAIASEEKPPIVVLNVVVVEAENLEAKDANGFSDPYCMLGIQPGNAAAPPSPQTVRETPPSPRAPASRALSDSGSDLESPKHESSHQEKLRKHHSFRLSFKRRDTISGRREGRDSISCAVPAKFIRATSVRPQTLNPRWNEKFRFDIDDLSTDILHLDIWDHDDESSVLDAVSHLNEVRGVKGLGRFFKQIAQSARSGSQDDFLGCVNVSLQDIPSTGLDCWYKLEARTQRSNIQGRIRLKLWLTTREDRGTSEEDNWSEIHQQEQLHSVFIGYELSKHRGKSWEWTGDLPQVALTILHQHAIQGDVTDLQLALVRWVAYSKTNLDKFLDPKIPYKLLQEMDQIWGTEALSKDEEECLAESFNSFVEYSLYLVRRHRIMFPPQQRATMTRFDYLLRCLGLLANMKAFWKCCPFHKEIRGEIILALKKGTAEWYEEVQAEALSHPDGRDATVSKSEANKVDHSLQALTHLVTVLLVDVQTGIQAFNPLFEQTHGVENFLKVCPSDGHSSRTQMRAQEETSAVDAAIEAFGCFLPASSQGKNVMGVYDGENLKVSINNVQYFNAVYKQLEKMINHDMGPTVAQLCSSMVTDEAQLVAQNIQFGTPVFELYLALQEFVSLKENLNPTDQKLLAVNNYYQWFEPALEQWLNVAKMKALYRIKAAFELSRMVTGDRIVKHSTSAIDATACFYQIQEFWRQLGWPDLISAYNFVMTIIDIITSSSLYYSDLVQQKLQDSGYYEDTGAFKVSDDMCIAVNDLEYVRRSLTMLGTTLSVEPILEAVEAANGENSSQWRDALYGVLEETRLTLEARALQIMSRVGTKMRPSLKKVMFHLAWSPDSLPTAEAIAPLLELLDGYLVSLNAALLPRNFERALADIWDTVLLELAHQEDSTSGEKVAGFYDRLYEALELLVDFFHAEEKGLPLESIKSATYWQVEQRLSYHRTSTEELINLFYQQRLTDQLNTETSEYGVLSVRAYFNHDSLCVEVLNARDVIPLDPNGFSDPFVIVELLPRKVFAHCMEQQTNVHKKTLNPMFDECFEFSVTLEQCKSDGAMILFTVMDHDVLTANDFAGEAFLSLQTIPGVADNSSSVDNFHGLKTQDLNLMHQKNKNHPVLQILETRTWDRPAQEFVKKQKLRFANPS